MEIFSYNNITKCLYQSHLGVFSLILNLTLVFILNIKRCNKITGLLRRLSVCLPRKALLTIYKSFIIPHINYGNILYDKPDSQNFESKIEKVLYKACIAITSAIQRPFIKRL